MNSSENITDKRLLRALAVLRKKCEELLKIAPDFMATNSLEDVADGKAEITEKLWSIFCYGEYYVKKLVSDIPGPLLSMKGKENFHYYQNKYKLIIRKIEDVTDASFAPSRKEIEIDIAKNAGMYAGKEGYMVPPTFQSEIDGHMDRYEYCALNFLPEHIKVVAEIRRKLEARLAEIITDGFNINRAISDESNAIKTAIKLAIRAAEAYITDLWEEDRESWESNGLDLSDVENIVRKPYFNPDDWVDNENELPPIVITREIKQIPKRILERVNEIYRSFIFGNWMSVIALSRCLLEYAIIDRKSFLEIEIYLDKDKKRIKRLSDLASDVYAKAPFSAWKKNMENIIDAGNKVMHPSPRGNISKFPPGKKDAKRCVDSITKIIEDLYSA